MVGSHFFSRSFLTKYQLRWRELETSLEREDGQYALESLCLSVGSLLFRLAKVFITTQASLTVCPTKWFGSNTPFQLPITLIFIHCFELQSFYAFIDRVYCGAVCSQFNI